ncbi:MAG TPA: hypothetical protein PLN31_09440, partial [Azoarcus taiwanensis]|nr:hypothetical protein [Azoarcus taiwanensis]
FWASVEGLTRSRQINTALIHRPRQDPEPWLAMWPTGVCLRDKGWTGDSHRGLFDRPGSMREALYEAHAPKVRAENVPIKHKEKPTMAMKTNNAAPAALGSSQKAVLDVLYQNPCTAMSCSELAAKTGLTVENVYGACQGLIRRELIEKAPDGSKRYQLPPSTEAQVARSEPDSVAEAEACRGDHVADCATAYAKTPEPAPAEAATALEPFGAFQAEVLGALRLMGATPEAPASVAELAEALGTGIDNINQALRRLLGRELVDRRQVVTGKHRNAYRYWPVVAAAAREAADDVRVGLWDDGSLTIIDGDDILQYPPCVTARIARLLGVPSDVSHPLTRNTGA